MKSTFIIAGPQTGPDIIPNIPDKVFAGVPEIDISMVALASNDANELQAIRESRYNSIQEKLSDFSSEYNAAGEQFLLPSRNAQHAPPPLRYPEEPKRLAPSNPFTMLFNSKPKNSQTFTLDLDLNIPSKDLIKLSKGFKYTIQKFKLNPMLHVIIFQLSIDNAVSI